MNVPGLRIAVPSTPQDAYWQLRQAIVSDEPIILLEHELLYFSKGPWTCLPIRRRCIGPWCAAKDRDLTIVSYSRSAAFAGGGGGAREGRN